MWDLAVIAHVSQSCCCRTLTTLCNLFKLSGRHLRQEEDNVKVDGMQVMQTWHVRGRWYVIEQANTKSNNRLDAMQANNITIGSPQKA